MKFQIENIRVKTKTPIPPQYGWFTKLLIKWFKIEVEKQYNVDFYLTTFKEDYLVPRMYILISGGISIGYMVISKGSDKRQVVISSTKPMKDLEIKLACTSAEGAAIGSMCEETHFKRIKYPT